MKPSRAISLLWRAEIGALLRSPQGILGGCILLIAAGWALSKLGGNADLFNRISAGGLNPEESVFLAVVKWLAGNDAEYIERLIVECSPFLSIFFIVTVFTVPFAAMTFSLDQNASDIGNRGIRFYLFRARRAELFWGRWLGNTILFGAMCLVAAAAATTVALMLDERHGALEIVATGAWVWAALWLAAVPWISLMALCGNLTGNPLLAATVGFGSHLGVVLIGGFGGWMFEGLKVLRYLLPAPLRYQLLTGNAAEAMLAAVATLGYAAVFSSAAYFVLQRRDL